MICIEPSQTTAHKMFTVSEFVSHWRHDIVTCRKTQPTVSKHWRTVVSHPYYITQSHQAHLTMLQHRRIDDKRFLRCFIFDTFFTF